MNAELHKAKYPLSAAKVKKATLIDKADSVVDIRDILKSMDIWTPSGNYYSYKIYCPWHNEHIDQNDKNCRIFPPTNIYCWAHDWYITPTRLYSRWKGISRNNAAITLLDERGLLKKSWRETWNDLIENRNEQQFTLGSKQDVVSALHEKLRFDSVYVKYEFHPLLREKWIKVLLTLDKLWVLPDIGFNEISIFYDKSLAALKQAAKQAESLEQV